MLKLQLKDIPTCEKQEQKTKLTKPAWYKSSEKEKNEYTELLHSKLECLAPPPCLCCSDVNCQMVEHTTESDEHVIDVMCAVMEASYECIPLTTPDKAQKTQISSWNETVDHIPLPNHKWSEGHSVVQNSRQPHQL